MLTLKLIIAAVFLLGFLVLILGAWLKGKVDRIPYGWEDELGYHDGKPEGGKKE